MSLAAAAPEPAAAPPSAAQAASGSSFYAGMRVLPKPQREAMYAVYGFCRIVDDIADEQALPIPQQRQELQAWRHDIEALYAGRDAGRAAMLKDVVFRYGLDKADFLAVVDGMEMDLEGVVGPDLDTLYLYCDRVAVAVGRLSVKIFGMPEPAASQLAHHLGRALQLTNILRDIDEDAGMGRLYLPVEYLREAGIDSIDPKAVAARPEIEQVCVRLAETADAHFLAARKILAARPPGRLAAPRLVVAVYAAILKRLKASRWRAPRSRVKVAKSALLWMLVRHGIVG